MKFKPYPKYKASGVEWLGNVPEGWTANALKRGYQVSLGKMLQPEAKLPTDFLASYLRAANIQWDFVDTSDVKKMYVNEIEYKSLQLLPNDLLVSEGGDVGRSAIWRSELVGCCIQNSVNRVRAIGNNSNRFLFYWLRTIKEAGYIDVLCNKSTIAHFTAEKVEAVPVAFPPTSVQSTIAAFLDRETAKIDTLITKQEKLIELLKEKRQAVISHAVTKGLDPDVPMKPSGVEWLGDVPEHWVKTRIKYLLASVTDTEHKTAPFYPDGEYFVVRTTNVKNGKLVFDGAKFTDRAGYDEWTVRGKPCPGDIIFTREAPAGEACIVPSDMDLCLGQRTVLMKVNTGLLDSRFALWSIYGGLASEFIELLSQGSTVAHFNMGDIGNIPMFEPPLFEQNLIVDHLDKSTTKIDTLIAKAKQAIALQKEHRTALISAAVTGKIDVRNEIAVLEAA